MVFLLANKGIYLSDACLAFAVEKSLADVVQAIASVERLEEFDRHESPCAICARVKPVTAAALEVADSESAAEGGPALLTGTAQYRGWRIDVLSYQVPGGWRPFIVVKRPIDVADAPSLLTETFPAKGQPMITD